MKLTINEKSVESPGGPAILGIIKTLGNRIKSMMIEIEDCGEDPIWAFFPLDCKIVDNRSLVDRYLLEIFELNEIVDNSGEEMLNISIEDEKGNNHTFKVQLKNQSNQLILIGDCVGNIKIPNSIDEEALEDRRQFAAETFMEDEGFAGDLSEACDDPEDAEDLFVQGEDWSIEIAEETIRMMDDEEAQTYMIWRIKKDPDSVHKKLLESAASL